uniref:protein SPIRAL1-like 2 n=1 Tax=Erigeron canadensis TaxID=72917 RepID=UPI001CB90764|nr:protein SPIRAL1-like 2 [Erigeron canadensis]
MGRGPGVSCNRGQSSLGYLLGGDVEEKGRNARPTPEVLSHGATTEPSKNCFAEPSVEKNGTTATTADEPDQKPASKPFSVINQNPRFSAHNSTTNNYPRENGQNRGNFVTNRSSTKVNYAPGGSSSLGYLFGGDKK